MNRYMRGMSNGGAIMARGNEPLALEQIAATVPSIFANEAHESRSQRYAHIPTSTVLQGLMNQGFQPFFAQQSRTRIAGKQEFTKHMIRLRHDSRRTTGNEAHEIILINSSDGTSSYQMMSGLFRFVCANGLFVGDSFAECKVRHSGDAVNNVIEGAYEVLDDSTRAMAAVDQFKAITLNDDERMAFADAALTLRYEPKPDESRLDWENRVPITPKMLLQPKRSDDRSSDLWTTFNVVQEHAIQGGQRGFTRPNGRNIRRSSSRAVSGIDQTKSLNRALWALTERMNELKGGMAIAA